MPEGPEVTILSQFLNSKLKNKTLESINILGGKYKRIGIKNIDKINNKNLKIKTVDSKGKLMWFELSDDTYITSHLGLSGFWSFHKDKSDRLRFTIKKEKKEYFLCYQDPRNFGNIEIVTKDELDKKLSKLADDALKTSFTNKDFENLIEKYLSVSNSRKHQTILKVLMEQDKKDGLVSGLGNYLVPEILYASKIHPSRTIGSLTLTEKNTISYFIRYKTKLSYTNNPTGYMTNFGNFIEKHKDGIFSGKYPDYHTDIKLKKTDQFEFNVYQQKTDPLGNPVEANKELNKGRTTYLVPSVQK